jgi:hypothetical protein
MTHEGAQRCDRGDRASVPQEDRQSECMRARQTRFDIGDAQRGQGGEAHRQVGRQRRTAPQHPGERSPEKEATRRSGVNRVSAIGAGLEGFIRI